MLKAQYPPKSRLITVAVVFLFTVAVDQSLAQTGGHWRGDQYVGFVPKHLQQQTPEELKRAATTLSLIHI